MKKILAFLLALALPFGALAQSAPTGPGPEYYPVNWVKGYVPTTYEWQVIWSNKIGYYVNGIPINLGGTGATNAAAALANLGGASSALNSGNIFIGNSSNVATGRTMSGDGTLTNLGALSITNLSHVTNASLPNSGLVNSKTTVNSVDCVLGSTCTTTAAAGTLTGNTLNSPIVTSSLTSVGTLTGGATGVGFTVDLGNSTISGRLALANFVQGAANTVLTNATGSLANFTAFAMPSCDGGANAIIWTPGTGWGCNTFSFGSGTVTAVSVASANGFAGSSSGGATPALTLTTSITGVLKGNSTAISAATAGSDYVAPGTVTAFTASQRGTPTAISISTATFTPNFDTGQNYSVTLVHASCPCTIANPSTTPVAGQSGTFQIIQSSTGSDTIGTWGSSYKFAGGTKPTLSTAANAVDVVSYYVVDSTHIQVGTFGLAFQ